MVSPQFVAETLVALERLGAQPTLNIFDGTISLAGRLPPLAAAPRHHDCSTRPFGSSVSRFLLCILSVSSRVSCPLVEILCVGGW